MQAEQINAVLREMFNDLVNDGYKKSHICGITLGCSNVPQFDSFMKGNDFGIKPLQRIINNQKYELKLILVPKDNKQIDEFVDSTNVAAFEDIKSSLSTTLNDEVSMRSASVPKTGVIAEVTADLFNDIIT